MVDRVLIDSLSLKNRDFAIKWKDKVRRSSNLKHYGALDDESLITVDAPFYPLLARTLDRGIDRSLIGDFFVKLGKSRMQDGFPVSEVIYAVNLAQQVVIEYLMTDFVLDSTVRMYQAMGAVTRVAEFFLLGSFYLTKGFLEATYTDMSRNDEISETILKKYFTDDFFFKND
ncbi:MAG: hypothetical protein LBQ38_13185 [Spirochaetaceae bacterium]|jgi:hypothetical protein|nr:hypothetical protein [Spirochaetaceae bacterium]